MSLSSIDGQDFRMTFNNIALSDALVQVSNQLDIKVAFDSKKLGSVKVSKEVSGDSADEVITNLLSDTGFDFRMKYNRYLIVETEKKNEKEQNSLPLFSVLGSVSDIETGESLPYATLRLKNENIMISASGNGSFSFNGLKSNTLSLTISYIGYNTLDTTILLTDVTGNIDLLLRRQMHLMNAVVVKGSRLEMVDLRNDVDFATIINPSRLNDLPAGAETDVFRMLQLIPGISYSENGQGLSIRGGSSDQNLILLDGQTIYNISHYYGIVSSLNPNIVKDLQVYKGGYDSRFGEKVSGIVDITGKTGNQIRPKVYGDLNLLSGNITAEIPVGKKISFIGAVRRSYSDIYATEFSDEMFRRNINTFSRDSVTIIKQTKPDYYFFDYNAKVTFNRSNVENISFSLYGGKDYFTNTYTGRLRRLIITSTDLNTWNNFGLGASWNRQWNESFFTSLQTGSSGYLNKAENETVIDRTHAISIGSNFLPDNINTFNIYNENSLGDIYISARNSFKQSNNNQLDFGMVLRKNTVFYHKDADKLYVYDNVNKMGLTFSTYVQERVNLSNKLTFKPGIRFVYFNNNNRLYIEPRFSSNYRLSDYLSVRMAAGRYHQFIKQVTSQQETGYNKSFWVIADNLKHKVLTSDHIIAGIIVEKGSFLLDAEFYYKSFDGLQEYIFVSQFLRNSEFQNYFERVGNNGVVVTNIKPSFFITGSGRSYGLDLLLRYKGNIYTGWLSFTTGRSIQNYRLINSGADIPAPVDQPFQASWTNLLAVRKWNFGTVTLCSSGKPFIESTTISTDAPILRIYNRLPVYFRTDVSANYNFTFQNSSIKSGITLINIFNTQNYFDVSTREFDFDNTSFSETTLVLSQALSVNLFLHFSF